MTELVRFTWNAARQRLRQLWLTRGGGYYGLVTALTFCYLEVTGVAANLAGLTHASLNLGWVIGFVVGNLVEAFVNALMAALWPLKWLGMFGVGPKLVGLLAGSYVLYVVTRPAILRLLGADEVEAELAAGTAGSQQLRS